MDLGKEEVMHALQWLLISLKVLLYPISHSEMNIIYKTWLFVICMGFLAVNHEDAKPIMTVSVQLIC